MPPRTRTTTNRSAREHDDLNDTHVTGQLDTTNPRGTPGGDEQPTPRDTGTTIRLPLPTLGDIDAKQLLWYGGLGALATLGILDWPVALVVGAGTIIATRSRRSTAPAAPTTSGREN
jgi:hypothetical protein